MADKLPGDSKNLDGYGAPIIEWKRVHDRLAEGFSQAPDTGGPNRHTSWLTTINPDGRPHVMPLGILWVNDAFYFNAGAGTRKAKNLERDARCTLSIATHPFDLVVEGHGRKVTDAPTVKLIAERFAADDGWPCTVTPDGLQLTAEFSAPAAGPPPWNVYEVTPSTVFALGTAEPYGATRFTF
jgi:Pyridoxamine 5'-phosphate oxidase